MQALDLKADLTLVKDGTDFVQTFMQTSMAEEGYVQVVDVGPDSVTVDIDNFTTVDTIVIYNRDLVTPLNVQYTNVQQTLTYAGDQVQFASATPDEIRSVPNTFLTDGWRAGMWVNVLGSSTNEGTFLVTRALADKLELASTVVINDEFPPAAQTITLAQHVRNRCYVGPGQFHVVAGSTLHLADELVLLTPTLQPTVQAEVWVFGT